MLLRYDASGHCLKAGIRPQLFSGYYMRFLPFFIGRPPRFASEARRTKIFSQQKKRKPRRNNRGFIQIAIFKFLPHRDGQAIRALVATKTSSKFALSGVCCSKVGGKSAPGNVYHPAQIAISEILRSLPPRYSCKVL